MSSQSFRRLESRFCYCSVCLMSDAWLLILERLPHTKAKNDPCLPQYIFFVFCLQQGQIYFGPPLPQVLIVKYSNLESLTTVFSFSNIFQQVAIKIKNSGSEDPNGTQIEGFLGKKVKDLHIMLQTIQRLESTCVLLRCSDVIDNLSSLICPFCFDKWFIFDSMF